MNNLIKNGLFCCMVLWTIAAGVTGQRSPYSLQTAVDALRRRELQLALKDGYNNPRVRFPSDGEEDDYWEGIETEGPSERRKINRLLAKYLENGDNTDSGSYENDFDDENLIPIDEKKRSFFRENEKNEAPPYMGSVFREREFPPNNQQELTDKFLREVEEEREQEREDRYKDALRNIYQKYQQQENEVDNDFYDSEKRKRFLTAESDTVGNPVLGAFMQKKRSYPVLPWLPYNQRRKRFPISKRSPKMPMKPFDTSDSARRDQISKDLEAIFGTRPEDKKKRSVTLPSGNSTSSENSSSSEENNSSVTTEKAKAKKDDNQHDQAKKKAKRNDHGDHDGHHPDHHNNHDSDESHESDEEHTDESHEDDHDDHSHEHDSDEDDEEKKKKRSVAEKKSVLKKKSEESMVAKKKRANLEVVKEDQIIPGDLPTFLKKDKLDWSNYFGIDRRKRFDRFVPIKKAAKKRSTVPIDLIADAERKKRYDRRETLDQIETSIKSIEDKIIIDTIKYVGANSGITDPEDIAELKRRVYSRIRTLYNLENMREKVVQFREESDKSGYPHANDVDSNGSGSEEEEKKRAAAKRLSVKKDKVEFENERKRDSSERPPESSENFSSETDDDKKKKKKKRNGGGSVRLTEPSNHITEIQRSLENVRFEPHNDVYLGRQNNGPLSFNQCPTIDSLSERCRNVDVLSGDFHQDLLTICGVHELCVTCGISPIACDLQYISDADNFCGRNSECQAAARSVLSILQTTPREELGPNECLKNPCLYRVMREIGL